MIKRQPKEIILSALARMAEQAPFYIFTAFVFSYGTGTLLARFSTRRGAVRLRRVVRVHPALRPHLRPNRPEEDVHAGRGDGRRLWLYLFEMLNTRSLPVIFLAIVLSLIPHDMMYGPQAALIAESFTGRLRYSGASLGYQLASVIAGGPAPLIATWLFVKYNSAYAVAVYIFVYAVLTLIATAMMKDYTGKDIEGDYE